MTDTLWGYVVFALGMVLLIALSTAAAAWWLRWLAWRWGFWSPTERGDSDKDADVASVK